MDDTKILMLTQGEVLGANLFAYCNNNPVSRIDPTGYASYKNTVTKSGTGWKIKSVISVLWAKLTYNYYITSSGVIQFDFSKNAYWSVLWRGGAKTLAEAAYKAVKSINSRFLSGRTIGGIHTEILLHWSAYTLGFKKSSSRVADMGGMWGSGYDSNAWFFEGANAAKIITKLSIWNVWGIVSLIRDIVRYF